MEDASRGEDREFSARLRLSPSPHVDLEEEREIKVRLPLGLHLKLHGLKITKGRGISEVVLEALEDYFAKMNQEMRR